MQNNFSEITLLHGCSPVNLLYIFRTVSYMITSRGLLLNIVTNKREREREREKGDKKIQCNLIMFIYLLAYLFLFYIVLSEITKFFYHKTIKAKWKLQVKGRIYYWREDSMTFLCEQELFKILSTKSMVEKRKELYVQIIIFFVLKTMYYRSGRTEVFCAKTVIKKL